MAGPVLTGRVVFVDAATRTLQKIQAATNQLTRSVQQQGGAVQSGMQIVQRANHAANRYAATMGKVSAVTKQAAGHTRDMHITLTGMLKVMVMFAVNLQIIRAFTSPYTFLAGGISQTKAFQDGMAQVNALLRLNRDEIKSFGREVQEVSSLYGIAQEDILFATKELASSISSLNLGKFSEQEAVLTMMRAAAKGVIIDNATLQDSMSALRTIMAGMNLEVQHAERVFDLLFATVDVGTIQFNQLEGAMAKWIGPLAALAPQEIEGRLKFLQEMLSMFGAMTNVMPASEAETATARILTALSKEAVGVSKIRQELEAITGIPLGLEVFTDKGFMGWIDNLSQAISRESPLVKGIIEGHYSDLSDEQKRAAEAALSTRFITALFPNIRASNPLMIALQDAGKQLQIVNEDLKNTTENTRTSFNIAYQTAERNSQRFKALYDAFRTSLLGDSMDEGTGLMTQVANAVHSIIFSEDFEAMNVAEKVRNVMNAISDTINTWWLTGGRKATLGFAHGFTVGLLTFLQTAVVDNMSRFIDVGATIAMGIVSGMIEYIMNPRNFTNPLVQMLTLKGLGFGWKTSIGAPVVAHRVNQALGDTYGGNRIDPITGAPVPGDEGGGGGGGFINNVLGLGSLITTIGGAMLLNRFGGKALQAGGKFAAGKASALAGAGLGSLWGMFGRSQGVRGLGQGSNMWMGRWAGGAGAGQFVNAKALMTTAALKAGLPLVGLSMIANGVGPFRNQGGLTGILSSAVTGSIGPEAIQQDSMDWKTIGATTAAGAAAGAMTGSVFGPLGTLIGTGVGGGLGFLGSWRQQRANAAFTAASTDPFGGGGNKIGGPAPRLSSAGIPANLPVASFENEKEFLAQMGIGNMPPGVVAEIVRQGKVHGITDPRELSRYVAFNLGVIEAESGFNASVIAKDPTLADPSAVSVGLYQLNTASTGQGYGHGIRNMQNPIYNTRVGAGVIAQHWDPNKNFFELAQITGHPGFSTQSHHVESARRVERLSLNYLNRMSNHSTFTDVANGGITGAGFESGGGGGMIVKVDGDMIIQANNPSELAAALASGLYDHRSR